jgi:hypothetical protein
MTLVIETRSDMGRVTRLLASHPEWSYGTRCGDNGTIVVEVRA